MGVALPTDKYWGVANWVARGLFEDSMPYLDEYPGLAEKIRFCVRTQFDMLDLEDADEATLRSFLALVDRVIAGNRERGGANFHEPAQFPVYMDKLAELRKLTANVTGPNPD